MNNNTHNGMREITILNTPEAVVVVVLVDAVDTSVKERNIITSQSNVFSNTLIYPIMMYLYKLLDSIYFTKDNIRTEQFHQI